MNTIINILLFYLAFSSFGIIGFALSSKFIPGKDLYGYLISKVLGLIVFGYLIWILSSLHIIKNSNSVVVFGIFIILSTLSISSLRKRKLINKSLLKKLFVYEIFFLALYLSYLAVRACNSEIYGFEKYMDLQLLVSVSKADYFPFADSWYATKDVNYYYYGFYLLSLVQRLSTVSYSYAYNLCLGIIFASSTLLAFSIIFRIFKSKIFAGIGAVWVMMCGYLNTANCVLNHPKDTFRLCNFSGNAQIISGGLNEFPLYSLLNADLHPHVINTPFFLLNIYMTVHFFLSKKLNKYFYLTSCLTFATAALVNTWDALIAGAVFGMVSLYKLFLRIKNKQKLKKLILYIVSFTASPFVLFLPFFLSFKSPVDGVGIVSEYIKDRGFDPGSVDFPFPISKMFLMWGVYFILFFIALFTVILFYRKWNKKFALILAFFFSGIFIIIFINFLYFKDINYISAPFFFRFNTIYKMGYSLWVVLSITGICLAYVIFLSLKRVHLQILKFLSLGILFIIMVFITGTGLITPYLGIKHWYTNKLKDENHIYTFDGNRYMEKISSNDLNVINWINKNIHTRERLIEAVGHNYTFEGRISANTGMINLINWYWHEKGWRHVKINSATPNNIDTSEEEKSEINQDILKLTDITETIYESNDWDLTKSLIKEYSVKYVYVSDQERSTYNNINENKFDSLCKIEYQTGNSKLYKCID